MKHAIKLVGLGFGAWGILVFIGLILAAKYHWTIALYFPYNWEFPIEMGMYIVAFICAVAGFIIVAREER